MKTLSFVTSVLFLVMTIFNLSEVQAQKSQSGSATVLKLDREIRFHEKESNQMDILVQVQLGTELLDLIVSSSITNGHCAIEIIDPMGMKQGQFSVGTQLNIENAERARGEIKKSMKYPMVGNWKVRIIPKAATGEVRILTLVKE